MLPRLATLTGTFFDPQPDARLGFMSLGPYVSQTAGKDSSGNEFPRMTDIYAMFRHDLSPPHAVLVSSSAPFDKLAGLSSFLFLSFFRMPHRPITIDHLRLPGSFFPFSLFPFLSVLSPILHMAPNICAERSGKGMSTHHARQHGPASSSSPANGYSTTH